MAPRHDTASDSTLGMLRNQSFPELAAALRSQTPAILEAWTHCVRLELPQANTLSRKQLQDSMPIILGRMADALASSCGSGTERLEERSPAQGITRFNQHYQVGELMLEDRLLRQVITEHVQGAMNRRMTLNEQIALDSAIDVVLQQAVVAFVGAQNARLQQSVEAELRYLAFLSHDLSNNLSSVTIMLKLLRDRLASSPEFAADVETLDSAHKAVQDTIAGMGRLLQAERLRKSGVRAQLAQVDLNALLLDAARQFSTTAEMKGLKIIVDADGVAVQSDRELVGLIIQNLVGNAVKYSSHGAVRLSARRAAGKCEVCVSDEGPGIATEHLGRIFDAFARGDVHGHAGVGLGLRIATQAAKLLGAQLTVESHLGSGSTFRLVLPDRAGHA